jgi:hypothetical protein
MIEEAYVVLHAKWPLLLTDFNELLDVSSDFSIILHCATLWWKLLQLPIDERVDMAKLSVANGSQNTRGIISAEHVSATPPGHAIHHGIRTPSVHQYYLRISYISVVRPTWLPCNGGCWEEYFDRNGMKWQEHCTMSSFIICTLRQV